MAVQKQDDQLELIYSNYVRTQDVTLKTCRKRLVIGRSGERGSGISVLAARHDDDDDDEILYSVRKIFSAEKPHTHAHKSSDLKSIILMIFFP